MNYFSEQYILIYLVIILTILEFLFPRVKIKITDEHFKEDAKWYVFNEHIVKNFLMFCESSVVLYLSSLNLQNRIVLTQQNIILQIVLFIMLNQFVGYWLHRLSHTSDFLWQFHKLHHSPTKLTATTNYRFSWIEEIIGGTIAVVVIGLFQFSESVVSIVFFILRGHCYFAHSNLNLNSKLLSKVFIMPRDHRWHHSKEKHFKYGQNFGGLLNICDRIFGTYYSSEVDPKEMGLNDEGYPNGVIKRIIYPVFKDGR